MTGLDPSINVIIEIATLVTDGDLNVLAEGPASWCINPTANSTKWTPGASGSTAHQDSPSGVREPGQLGAGRA